MYAALLPQPGHAQFYGYTLFYEAGSVRDADGERIDGIEAQAIAMAPRVLYTWKPSLWGFKLTSALFPTVLSAGIQTPEDEEFDTAPSTLASSLCTSRVPSAIGTRCSGRPCTFPGGPTTKIHRSIPR